VLGVFGGWGVFVIGHTAYGIANRAPYTKGQHKWRLAYGF